MANTVRLTWAIPVSAHLLGARLEAYVESKATISTIRLSAQYGNASDEPLARLPAESINEIVGYIGLSFFEKRLPPWEHIVDCLDGRGFCSHGQEDCVELHIDKLEGNPPDFVKGKRFAKFREVQQLRSIDDGVKR